MRAFLIVTLGAAAVSAALMGTAWSQSPVRNTGGIDVGPVAAPLTTGVPQMPGATPHTQTPTQTAQSADTAALNGAPQSFTEGKPVAFTDPKRHFLLVAPPGSRFQHRGDDQPIAIQSRKGFAVNIQVGDANPDINVQQMFAKLESQYLGDGKPWSVKLNESPAVIAGLPAASATYGAGSTRTRVVIARGQRTDFVFMFFAPDGHFEKLSHEFDWILTSFRPDPSELPKEPATLAARQQPEQAPPPVRAQDSAAAIPAGRPAPAPALATPPMHVFAEPGYGYRVEYPAEWQLEKINAYVNVISGRQGSPAFDAIVAVQNVQPAGASTGVEAATVAYNDLKASLTRDAQGVAFIGEKEVAYVKHGLNLAGRQFVANYDHQGRQFRKWALVLPRPDGTVAHIWSYTAPADQFDDFRPIAEQILQSLKIEAGQG